MIVGGASNSYQYEAAVYLFDGTATGTVDVADAQVVFDLRASGGLNLRSLADITGDGYEDLLIDISAAGSDAIIPGPLSATQDVYDSVLSGQISLVPSVDGNDSPDLVSLTHTGKILFYTHPMTATTYDDEDAYAVLDITSAPPEGWVSPSAADVDADGVPDLFIAALDYDLPYLAIMPIVLP